MMKGIYKRYLTEEEKVKLQEIINEYNLEQVISSALLRKAFSDFIHNLFETILYDFVVFQNIMYSDTKVILNVYKHESPFINNIFKINVEDLLTDNIILYTDCTIYELQNHILCKKSEVLKIINKDDEDYIQKRLQRED